MSDCECEPSSFHKKKNDRRDCIQKDSIPKNNVSVCICNYDRQDSTVWPCYLKKFVYFFNTYFITVL